MGTRTSSTALLVWREPSIKAHSDSLKKKKNNVQLLGVSVECVAGQYDISIQPTRLPADNDLPKAVSFSHLTFPIRRRNKFI